MPLETGARFDRYAIASLLGQGGMGEVYRAYDTKLQRSVALKILRVAPPGTTAGSQPSTDGVAQMMREARAAAALDHPNAIAIFDVGMVDGSSFIAMEFIEGKTLRAFVGDKAVPMKQRFRWLVDTARALAAAHDRGLVHRDIKPENIMVRDDGVVKVLDFGIARRTRAPVDALASTAGFSVETLSGKGLLVGTPHYMSPEQMRGETVTSSADIFSWGVVAYELLSGTLPWNTSSNAIELVSQILSSTTDPVGMRVPDLPPAVAALVMQALAKTPAARPPSMDAIVAALEPFADPSAQTRAPATRSSLPAPMAPSTRTQLAAPTQPPAAAHSSSRAPWIAGAGLLLAISATLLYFSTRPPATGKSATETAVTSASAAPESEPTSKNPEAASAFRIGQQAWRDAADDVAMNELEHAAQLDPAFAAAHLRRGIDAPWPDDASRQSYQRAVQLRASLGPRDRALLEAFEPWTDLAPDLAVVEQRLVAAQVRYPSDTEIALLLCRTRVTRGDVPGAVAACDGALHADAGLALAWYLEALAAGVKGDLPGATHAYAECLSRAPNASACLHDQIVLHANEGACDDALRTARSLVAAYPRNAADYVLLAQTLLGAGQPVESVRVALAQASRLGTDPRLDLRAQASVDVATGSFDAAAEKLRALEHAVEESTSEVEHFDVAYARMQVALESGKPADDARVAADYLKRRAAWTPAPNLDPSIYALREEYRAGALTGADFVAARAAWLTREERRPFPSALLGDGPADRWAVAFAGAASTAADAKEALAAIPADGAEPALLRRDVAWRDDAGRAYWLAGDAAHGLPLLQAAARTCDGLRHPIEAVHASADLGAALEATGDALGACAAYAKVVEQWGAAKPRSITADRAKQRVVALKCPP